MGLFTTEPLGLRQRRNKGIPGLPRCDDAIVWSSNQNELPDVQEVCPPFYRCGERSQNWKLRLHMWRCHGEGLKPDPSSERETCPRSARSGSCCSSGSGTSGGGLGGGTSHQEGGVHHTGELFEPGCYLSSSRRWKSSVRSCCSRCETRFSSCVREITTSGSLCLSGKITGS